MFLGVGLQWGMKKDGKNLNAPLAQIKIVSRPLGRDLLSPRPKGLAPSARRGKVSKGAVKGKPFRMGFPLTIPFLKRPRGSYAPPWIPPKVGAGSIIRINAPKAHPLKAPLCKGSWRAKRD